MEYNFDIEKIKYSTTFRIRKIELLKFLEFYFTNNRPKYFINYEKELALKLIDFCNNNEVTHFIDIGAAYSYFSILLKKKYIISPQATLI